MKQRRINLFSLTLKKFDFVTAAKKVQFSMIIVLLVLLLTLGLTAVINNYLDQELAAIDKSKKPPAQYFQSNADFDKKIKYFIYKYSLLKDYLKQDAQAYDYFLKLQSHILKVSPGAQIISFTVDNVGQTQFNVRFPNFDEATVFITALETPEFIEPFEYLKLSAFDVASKKVTNFELTIEGKFIK